ncbi:PREDICTED: uncharacterized protein LOC109213635 [Nicotiana attenuata]|uniref:uncharacterized protein LOC109213635 n=1 Tax=Nicotiana attenuata TaxID=49451 RepID=UPI0009052189|nr:PREDICTED: uncharacterized protein LOC109213635 [Nicotiana attenuata]
MCILCLFLSYGVIVNLHRNCGFCHGHVMKNKELLLSFTMRSTLESGSLILVPDKETNAPTSTDIGEGNKRKNPLVVPMKKIFCCSNEVVELPTGQGKSLKVKQVSAAAHFWLSGLYILLSYNLSKCHQDKNSYGEEKNFNAAKN